MKKMFYHSNLLLNLNELKKKIVTPFSNSSRALNHKSEPPSPFSITSLKISFLRDQSFINI